MAQHNHQDREISKEDLTRLQQTWEGFSETLKIKIFALIVLLVLMAVFLI